MALALGLMATAQVKIGDNPTTVDANSLLELETTNQGLLFPRVELVSTDSYLPLNDTFPNVKQKGMTVYNTATTAGATGVSPGLYSNDGTNWVKVGAAASSNLYTADGTLTGARTVTLDNNDLTFISDGNGKIVVDSDFKTGGAVYGNVRVEASVLTSAAWLDTDYIVIFTNASLTFTLPSATANPGRIICLNNATGGNKTYVADATFDKQPKGVSTLSGGKGQMLASIGNIWYVIGGF